MKLLSSTSRPNDLFYLSNVGRKGKKRKRRRGKEAKNEVKMDLKAFGICNTLKVLFLNKQSFIRVNPLFPCFSIEVANV